MHKLYTPVAMTVLAILVGCPAPPSEDATTATEETTQRASTLSADVTEVFIGGAVTGPGADNFEDPDTSMSTTAPDLPPVFNTIELFSRTFPNTRGATARRFNLGDLQRTPQPLDFNGDGQPDFAVINGEDTAVVQVFISQGAPNDFDFLSLSLDRPTFATIFLPDLTGASDIAVGDIDGDGFLDVVSCGPEGVFYLHHPNGTHPTENRPLNTTDFRYWNVSHIDGTSDIKISNPPAGDDFAASVTGMTELENMTGCIGCFAPGYVWNIDNTFFRVALGDMDNDGDLDIVASQGWDASIKLGSLTLYAESNIQAVWILFNPGNEVVGIGWDLMRLGADERASRNDTERIDLGFGPELPDRAGSIGLFLLDLDNDGDLDIINAAADDNNVQVAWFENPGPTNIESQVWTQWRVGSVRQATSIDVTDITGDGRHDVIIASSEQAQIFLFPQPSTGPKREFDWDGNAIYSAFSGGPTDVRAVDIDADGTIEIVTGQTNGRVLFLEPPDTNPLDDWFPIIIDNSLPDGVVGLLGSADFDGDGDLDLIITVDSEGDNADRVIALENVPQE